MALVPPPLGRPRLGPEGGSFTTPSTFPAASPETAGIKPSALSFASFFPSAHTDLSSSFLNSHANMLRSLSRLHSSWNVPNPGASRSFMLRQ